MFGTLTADTSTPYPFNSALLLDDDGDVRGTFDKNILMVFGEYIPYYEQLKFIKKLDPGDLELRPRHRRQRLPARDAQGRRATSAR